MHIILCPQCGGFTLFYRKPNGWRGARCIRHPRCRDVAQLHETSGRVSDLQALAMAHRGERSTRDMLVDWTEAVRRRDELRDTVRALRAAHPDWHRLKCVRKARDQVHRARRDAYEERNPKARERRLEQHPKWNKLARRARRALEKKADRIDRKPYTKGPHTPRYSAPDWVYGDDPAVYSR